MARREPREPIRRRSLDIKTYQTTAAGLIPVDGASRRSELALLPSSAAAPNPHRIRLVPGPTTSIVVNIASQTGQGWPSDLDAELISMRAGAGSYEHHVRMSSVARLAMIAHLGRDRFRGRAAAPVEADKQA